MSDDFTPDFSLRGKVVMVTAAARGIGRACALACAAAGADIAAVVREDDGGLGAAIEALGRRVLVLKLDVTKTGDIDGVIDRAVAHFGRIDVLVNNAGIARDDLAEDVKEADFDLVLGTNLKGTFFVTQAVGKAMLARKSGRIINISSQAGTVTLRGESIYCMTKAAINHLTRCLAAEWGPQGVAVNSVSPTFIWTDGTRPFLSNPASLQETVDHIPLGRIGETKEVSSVVVFLASPAASLMNGANLLVDGGWSVA